MVNKTVYCDENGLLIKPTKIPDFKLTKKQSKLYKTFGGGLLKFSRIVDAFGFPCVLKQSRNKKIVHIEWNLKFVDGTITIINSKINLEKEMNHGEMFIVRGQRYSNIQAWELVRLYTFY